MPVSVSAIVLRAALLAALLLPATVWGQKIASVGFKADKYQIERVGYPSKIIPGEGNVFYYVEYWESNPQLGRSAPGYYLQCMAIAPGKGGAELFDEKWAKALVGPGMADWKMTDIYGLSGTIGAVGRAATKKKGVDRTVIRFWDYSGTELGPLQDVTPVMDFDLKSYEDHFATSASQEKLAWYTANTEEPASKRTYHVAVFSSQGRLDWRKSLVLKDNANEYVVKDMAVDMRSNVYFLAASTKLTGTAKDSLLPPKLLKYDSKSNAWSEYPIQVAEAWQWPVLKLYNTPDDEIVVVGVANTATSNFNAAPGADAKITTQWGQLFYRKYSVAENMAVITTADTPLPDTLVARYSGKTPRFSDFRVHTDAGGLYLLAEEAWQEGNLYLRGQVLTLSLNPAGTIKWANVLAKSQHDNGSDALFSYTIAPGKVFLHLFYLTEKGAPGKLRLYSINRETGGAVPKDLGSNENSNSYFLPRRSAIIDGTRLMTIGLGFPGKNEYLLIHIKPLP